MTRIKEELLADLPVPRPSFAKGYARGIDLFGVFRQSELDPLPMTDEEAFAFDWEVIGRDLRRAFEQAGIR
jgi:hypothetical protein